MKRTHNRICLFFFVLFLFLINSCSKKVEKSISVKEPETPVVLPGRIIVLVVDISQSIKNQLPDIINGLCEKIVDERLESNDYCVVVPLADASFVDKAETFPIKFSSEKEKLKRYLKSMESWMPSTHNTDIGAAMKKTFQFVNMIDEENDGNMLEPLVLFITDGEIARGDHATETLKYITPDEIFNDSMMDPSWVSYENWWFLGIENEGVPLKHIKNIAQRVNAYPDRYETLNDMSQFGILFDKWLSRIPPVKPKDSGRITFYDVKLGDNLLSTQNTKYTVVSNHSDLFTWQMHSEYKINNVVMNFTSIKGSFQKDATGESVEFKIIPEVGNIEFTPGSIRETRGNVKLPAVSGKGKLKLTINTELNEESEGQIPEYLFFVELKSPFAIIMGKILPFVLIILFIVLLVILVKVINARKPIKIKLELVGKKNIKPRIIAVRIKKEFEFGSKAGLALRLEGTNVPPVIGTITRTGQKEWKITPKSEDYFAPNQRLDPYSLSSSVKLVLKDGSTCIIKFMKAR